ncbi:MAG: lyase family protein [Candidatus Methanofastidiosia archaeon]
MKLWQKDVPHDEVASNFASSSDRDLDMRLLPFDCKASIAHARSLHKIGILGSEELAAIKGALTDLLSLVEKGEFTISEEDEDCHSAIERYLTEKLGDTGRKIHTCRSRNDQVLCALRLCYISEIEGIVNAALDVIAMLKKLIAEKGDVAFAGHTHTRKAMPTTIKDWAEGYVASICDSISSLEFVAKIISSNPLGTGAGYGLPIQTDRRFVADELSFRSVDVNGIYSQLSRTKHDKMLLSSLNAFMYDLNRLSSDIILFSYPDMGYFKIEKSMTTGSSIMPQKTNPDVLEVVRGYYAVISGYETQVAALAHNLISGYHRDLQLSKGAVFNSFDIVLSSLSIMEKVLATLDVCEDACKKSLSPEVFLTEKAYDLVKKGVPFRAAYRKVADEYFSDHKGGE